MNNQYFQVIGKEECPHKTTITDWFTGKVSEFYVAQPGVKIPARGLDMSKVAAAQQQANAIREELAPVVVLDMTKVAKAKADAAWIMKQFGH